MKQIKRDTISNIKQIKSLPARSGVYLFKDADGQILYVGKAKKSFKKQPKWM